MRLKWMLILLSICAPIMFVPTTGTANAVSTYDDAYITTDTLEYGESSFYGVNCPYVDVSATLYSLLNDQSNWQNSADYDDYWPLFDVAQDEGSWALSQYRHQAGGGESRQVWVVYSPTPGEVYWPDAHNVRATSSQVIYLNVITRQNQFGYGGCSPLVQAYPSTEQDISRSTVYAPQYTENYTAVNWDVEYPEDYAGELVRGDQPPAKYVAMGDSFSSGEGNPAFEIGTEKDGVNECHRSPMAYPRLLQNDSDLGLESTAFIACAGATTSDVLYGDAGLGNWGEGPQVDVLSAETELVTMTIGGNDIKFGEFAQACVLASCNTKSDAYRESMSILTDPNNENYFKDRVLTLYEQIATSLTPANTDAKVIVAGYPYIVTYAGFLINKLINQNNCRYLSPPEADAIEKLIAKLNATIGSAVTEFGDSRFAFADPNKAHSINTELCSKQSHFNGVDPVNRENSFHPNAKGHEDYKLLIEDLLSQ